MLDLALVAAVAGIAALTYYHITREKLCRRCGHLLRGEWIEDTRGWRYCSVHCAMLDDAYPPYREELGD